MFDPKQYQLIDFGRGKKIESFAGVVVQRDSPAAAKFSATRSFRTNAANVVYTYQKGNNRWICSDDNIANLAQPWIIRHGAATFNLKLTPFGHLGVFPEQASNWHWLERLPVSLEGKTALNLFAYTGGVTMVLAGRGAKVTHVDSAKNVVRWASDNARSAGMGDYPIRWIVEDALKFVNRQIKRGQQFDIVVADPPAIGHAANKMTWKIERDFDTLLNGLAQLCKPKPTAVLISCHSQGFDSGTIAKCANEHFKFPLRDPGLGKMDLLSQDGRKLNCGHYFRWHSAPEP